MVRDNASAFMCASISTAPLDASTVMAVTRPLSSKRGAKTVPASSASCDRVSGSAKVVLMARVVARATLRCQSRSVLEADPYLGGAEAAGGVEVRPIILDEADALGLPEARLRQPLIVDGADGRADGGDVALVAMPGVAPGRDIQHLELLGEFGTGRDLDATHVLAGRPIGVGDDTVGGARHGPGDVAEIRAELLPLLGNAIGIRHFVPIHKAGDAHGGAAFDHRFRQPGGGSGVHG